MTTSPTPGPHHERAEILLLPHDGDELEIRTWEDGAGEDRLVVRTWSDRTLVLGRDGRAIGWLDDDGPVVLGGLASVGPDRLLVRGRDGPTLLAFDG